MDTQKIEAAVKMIIEAVGEDVNREGLQETPARVLSLIHISEPTRQCCTSRMPSSA